MSTRRRTQWDVITSDLVPFANVSMYDAPANRGDDRSKVLHIEFGWLGLYFSLCLELKRPSR